MKEKPGTFIADGNGKLYIVWKDGSLRRVDKLAAQTLRELAKAAKAGDEEAQQRLTVLLNQLQHIKSQKEEQSRVQQHLIECDQFIDQSVKEKILYEAEEAEVQRAAENPKS